MSKIMHGCIAPGCCNEPETPEEDVQLMTRGDWLEQLLETDGLELHVDDLDLVIRGLHETGLVSISAARGPGKAFHRVELTGLGRLAAAGVLSLIVDEIFQHFQFKTMDCGSMCEHRAQHIAENKALLMEIIQKHVAPLVRG
jgi:hypothetical protein